jgi:hypothetical protein
MSIRSKFLIFVAAPVAIVTIASVSASSFTFGQTVSTALQAEQEQVNYLFPATSVTSAEDVYEPTATLIGGSAIAAGDISVATKYGELPQWTQISNGGQGVPSSIQQPGDLLFVNARSSSTSSTDDNNGLNTAESGNLNDVAALNVKGNIVNLVDLRSIYASCLIPIRLWKTTNLGDVWTDVTSEYFAGIGEGEPYYIDCHSGEFEFTVPTATPGSGVSAELDYAVTVEAGGNFATMNVNYTQGSEVASPKFLFRALPIARAFTLAID